MKVSDKKFIIIFFIVQYDGADTLVKIYIATLLPLMTWIRMELILGLLPLANEQMLMNQWSNQFQVQASKSTWFKKTLSSIRDVTTSATSMSSGSSKKEVVSPSSGPSNSANFSDWNVFVFHVCW